MLLLVLLCCRNGLRFGSQFSVLESFQSTSCTAFVSTELRRLASRADNSSFCSKLQKFQHSSKRQRLQDAIPGEPASIKMPETRPARRPKPSKRVSLAFWSAFLSARVSNARLSGAICLLYPHRCARSSSRGTAARNQRAKHQNCCEAATARQHALRCSGGSCGAGRARRPLEICASGCRRDGTK